MSVIIKGLNKFYSCRLCPFNNSDCYCNITKGRIDRDDYSCEAECPIVQLPKCHGRLIDADEILKAMNTWDKFGYTETGCFVREPCNDYVPYVHYEDMVKSVNGTPTIIEADGGNAE